VSTRSWAGIDYPHVAGSNVTLRRGMRASGPVADQPWRFDTIGPDEEYDQEL